MKIGIFGGSFNPVHVGHAILANYISQYTDIDEVWFMVSPQNPLKDSSNYIADEDRLKMVKMVCDKCPNVKVSDFEFSLPLPSYTINTLEQLARQYPNNSFKLIIGSDNLAIFEKWKDSEKIINHFGLIVYPRKGYDIKYIGNKSNIEILHDAPEVEVSSTFIREGINSGQNMSFFMPDDVYEYIIKHSLYK